MLSFTEEVHWQVSKLSFISSFINFLKMSFFLHFDDGSSAFLNFLINVSQ